MISINLIRTCSFSLQLQLLPYISHNACNQSKHVEERVFFSSKSSHKVNESMTPQVKRNGGYALFFSTVLLFLNKKLNILVPQKNCRTVTMSADRKQKTTTKLLWASPEIRSLIHPSHHATDLMGHIISRNKMKLIAKTYRVIWLASGYFSFQCLKYLNTSITVRGMFVNSIIPK